MSAGELRAVAVMRPGARAARVQGLSLGLVLALTVLGATSESRDLTLMPSVALVLLFVVVALPSIKRVARVFVLVALACLPTLVLAEVPMEVLVAGLTRAAYYCSFFTALTLIRGAAERSPLLAAAGSQVIRQPPRRRFLTLTLGSHLFGLTMSFGALTMLSTMVMGTARSLAAAGAPASAVSTMKRQSLLALLRGFTPTAAWSPLSVTPLVVVSLVPGMSWERLLPVGMAVAVLLLVLGVVVNRVQEGATEAPLAVGEGAGWGAVVRLCLLVAGLLFAVVLLALPERLAVSDAVMIATSAVTLLWIALQARGKAPGETARRYRELFTVTLPRQSTEIIVLLTAGFIGVVLSAVVPTAAVASLLGALPYPAVVLGLVSFWVVVLLGMAGFNPIITVTLLGATFADPQALGVPGLFLAGVYLFSWALSTQISPFTASALSLSSVAGMDSRDLVFVWNRVFALVAVVLASAGIVAVALLMG